jgi:hypothetical protein
MRKTVQEWLDAHHHSNGPAKKKIAGLKRLKRIPSKPATNGDALPANKHRAKKKPTNVKRRPR